MDSDTAQAFVAERSKGVLVTLKSDGRPQLSNIVFAPGDRQVRISVTDDRAKTANLRRDRRASLHVTTEDFWQYVVVEGDAELSSVAREPGDATCLALREVYRAISGEHEDWDDYDAAMIDDHRLVITLRWDHAYGSVR